MRVAIFTTAFFASLVSLLAETEKEIAQVEERLRQAYLGANIPALRELLADDYKVVHVNGREQTKAQFIDALQSGRAKFLSIEIDEKEVRDFGDTAVVIARWTNTIEFKGARNHGQDRVTDVWMKRSAGWQLVSSQAAFIEEPKEASSSATDDEKEILRLEKVIRDAWLKHEVAAVGAIVADDFESWSLKGKRHNKADLLRSVEKNREEATRVDDEKVRVFGDTAIYTARITDMARDEKGESFEAATAVTAVFVRRDGKWQMVQNHDSVLQK